MVFEILIVLGAGVLSFGLRSYHHPLFHKLGTLGIFLTSFLAGWLLGGKVWIGVAFAASWLFLPWLEILTRIRQLRLPAQRRLEQRTPPTSHVFPDFADLTDEIEANDFEHVEDAGWEFEGLKHFYRIFYHEELRMQATICLIEQYDLSFYYLAITSRSADYNQELLTWNYPFSYGMKMPPSSKVQRVDGEVPFDTLVERHREFLHANGLTPETTANQSPAALSEGIRESVEKQISHNVEIGLLVREPDDFIRYSVRGMFFLWFQFLRDLVRLS